MKVVTLYGNMRSKSNTRCLTEPFHEELRRLGADIKDYSLRDMRIDPCVACWVCQDIHDRPGCPLQDDMGRIMDAVADCDLLVIAPRFIPGTAHRRSRQPWTGWSTASASITVSRKGAAFWRVGN